MEPKNYLTTLLIFFFCSCHLQASSGSPDVNKLSSNKVIKGRVIITNRPIGDKLHLKSAALLVYMKEVTENSFEFAPVDISGQFRCKCKISTVNGAIEDFAEYGFKVRLVDPFTNQILAEQYFETRNGNDSIIHDIVIHWDSIVHSFKHPEEPDCEIYEKENAELVSKNKDQVDIISRLQAETKALHNTVFKKSIELEKERKQKENFHDSFVQKRDSLLWWIRRYTQEISSQPGSSECFCEGYDAATNKLKVYISMKDLVGKEISINQNNIWATWTNLSLIHDPRAKKLPTLSTSLTRFENGYFLELESHSGMGNSYGKIDIYFDKRGCTSQHPFLLESIVFLPNTPPCQSRPIGNTSFLNFEDPPSQFTLDDNVLSKSKIRTYDIPDARYEITVKYSDSNLHKPPRHGNLTLYNGQEILYEGEFSGHPKAQPIIYEGELKFPPNANKIFLFSNIVTNELTNIRVVLRDMKTDIVHKPEYPISTQKDDIQVIIFQKDPE